MKTLKVKAEITIKVREDGRCSLQCPGFGHPKMYRNCVFGIVPNSYERLPNCIKAEEEQSD